MGREQKKQKVCGYQARTPQVSLDELVYFSAKLVAPQHTTAQHTSSHHIRPHYTKPHQTAPQHPHHTFLKLRGPSASGALAFPGVETPPRFTPPACAVTVMAHPTARRPWRKQQAPSGLKCPPVPLATSPSSPLPLWSLFSPRILHAWWYFPGFEGMFSNSFRFPAVDSLFLL